MKLLITGTTGQIGSNLLPYMTSLGKYEIFGASRSEKDNIKCDFTDRKAVFKLLDDIRPDILINLIGLINVDECEKNPNMAFLINVRTIENVVNWIKDRNSYLHLIQLSTDHVYNSDKMSREEDVELVNTYAITKYRSEEVVTSIDNSTVLRTNFFGKNKGKPGNSFIEFVIRNLKKEKHFSISSSVSFSPISIGSLCRYISTVIEKPRYGIYNLGSRDCMTKGEFVKRICSHIGTDYRYLIPEGSLPNDNRVRRPINMSMDSSKFEEAFELKLPTLEKELNKFLIENEF